MGVRFVQIYKKGKRLSTANIATITSDIRSFAGIVMVQSLTTADDKDNNLQRPAAQVASFIIGSVEVSRFQSLLTGINLTPISAHIDAHSGRVSSFHEKNSDQSYKLRNSKKSF